MDQYKSRISQPRQISLLGFSRKRASKFSVLTTRTNTITVNIWLLLSVLKGFCLIIVRSVVNKKFTTTWVHEFPNFKFLDHTQQVMIPGLAMIVLFFVDVRKKQDSFYLVKIFLKIRNSKFVKPCGDHN